MSLTKASFSMINGASVNVLDYGADPTGVADSTAAIQAAVNYLISLAPTLQVGGSTAESTFTANPNLVVYFPIGKYKIAAANGVVIAPQTGDTFVQASITFSADQSGAALFGDNTNIGINFNGGGYRNKFENLILANFLTAIRLSTTNKNESMFQVDNCRSQSNTTFLDTVSYATTRSTMIDIRNSFCGDTVTFVKHYTDHMTIRDCWMYAKKDSYPALLYLSGDGNVNLYDNFFIPHGNQIPTPENSRWIDFVSDSAQGTASDGSLKFLNIRGCRNSLESSRPFIWTYANTAPTQPFANPSITIEDSVIGGTGGASVITYKTGYPSGVNLKNCKILSSYYIVGVDASNSTYPEPSTAIGSTIGITNHVIMVDEATRLSQNNVYTTNLGDLIDPKLMPFYYDTTTQTSKYKTTFPWQVPSDYRMATQAATAGNVKVVFPIFFDYDPAVANRDICSFILVTVSDAQVGTASPVYRSQATSLVTITGQFSSPNNVKVLNVTTLQDAQGGYSATQSAVPTVFWGSGSTGSQQVIYTGSGNPEQSITVEWPGTQPLVCWAYIIPLSGIRPNQASLKQYDNW
jgi:hypothetical protein